MLSEETSGLANFVCLRKKSAEIAFVTRQKGACLEGHSGHMHKKRRVTQCHTMSRNVTKYLVPVVPVLVSLNQKILLHLLPCRAPVRANILEQDRGNGTAHDPKLLQLIFQLNSEIVCHEPLNFRVTVFFEHWSRKMRMDNLCVQFQVVHD